MELLSIIVPCYNEQEAIPIFYNEINKIYEKMKNEIKFEVIFINDGSKDNTLKELKKLAQIDKMIKYISFSKNFGKESAMYAGLEKSNGDYVAVMDVD
ncbi:MAG: glycosyltransferase, partial [Clostridia bacterium]